MADTPGPNIPQRAKRKKQHNPEICNGNVILPNGNHDVPVLSISVSNASESGNDNENVQAAMKATNHGHGGCITKEAVATMSREDQRDSTHCGGLGISNSSGETKPNPHPQESPHLSSGELKPGEKRPSLRGNGNGRNPVDRNSVKMRNHRRKSSTRKYRLSQLQLINFKPFEIFQQLKSISMSLDWIHFKICHGEDEKTELFQAVQSKYCSLRVTNANEILIRKPNAENVLRIHSSIVEDARNFDFYTNCEHYIGSLVCDARQTFKLPSRIENKLTGEIYSVTVEREGEVKFWKIAFVPKTTTNSGGSDNVEENSDAPPVAHVKVHIGHRWKSVYRLTFLQEISISNQILLLGFLLALASARLESEIFPVFFAVSAIFVTFIIFFIIQFT